MLSELCEKENRYFTHQVQTVWVYSGVWNQSPASKGRGFCCQTWPNLWYSHCPFTTDSQLGRIFIVNSKLHWVLRRSGGGTSRQMYGGLWFMMEDCAEHCLYQKVRQKCIAKNNFLNTTDNYVGQELVLVQVARCTESCGSWWKVTRDIVYTER